MGQVLRQADNQGSTLQSGRSTSSWRRGIALRNELLLTANHTQKDSIMGQADEDV